MSVAPFPSAAAVRSPRTRVMVVDDSVVVRGLVARWVSEAGFEVVATAENGRVAVEALARVEPDIVLLDLEMPEMDGLAALPLLLRRSPGMRVVVVSSQTRRDAEISLECLALGAVDYIPKPSGHRQVSTSLEFRTELIGKLRALSEPRPQPAAAPAGPSGLVPSRLRVRPRCLLIGASTGGPRAIEEVLIGMGSALQQLPVLVVQHMPPLFTRVFADHLRVQVGACAREPEDGEPLRPGTIYVAPGGRHMGLSAGAGEAVIRLDDGPAVNFCRPAVDVLFQDAAAVFGAAALGLVLTGMGTDGTEGSRTLVRAGAAVFVQDEATSTIWGMPGSIVRAGLARRILPLEAIGPMVKSCLAGAVA